MSNALQVVSWSTKIANIAKQTELNLQSKHVATFDFIRN